MSRVPLPFRGVAVLLLVASTALGQTPEPPAEFSLDPVDSSSPDLLRQFSTEIHNPLLNLMVDGEFTSTDAAPQKEASKIKPTPQSKTTEGEAIEVDGYPGENGCPNEVGCPTAPCFLPYACPQPPQQQCHCRKCQRQRKHCHGNQGGCGQGCGNGYGGGYGNPYLNWPTCPAWCFYGAPLVPCEGGCCQRKHGRHGCGHGGCGNQGCGCGYGGWQGWNSMCGGYWNDGCCGGCMPYVAPPPPPQQCHCRKCQRHHGCSNNNGYGGGYGYGYGGWGGGYGGGWGMGCGGFMDGCCGGCMPCMAPPPPPQQCHCRKCQRHHGCSNNFGNCSNYGYGSGCSYGYCGYGCPGWSVNECNQGCGRHHRNRHHHGNSCQQQPYACYGCPMMMPCAGNELLYGQGAFGCEF